MRRRLKQTAIVLSGASIVTTIVTFTRPVAHDGLWFSAVVEGAFAFAIVLALFVSNETSEGNTK